MKWFGRRRETTSGRVGADDDLAEAVASLREASRAAESIGNLGGAAQAAEHYAELVARAEHVLGPKEADTLALRHQLAHWTGESGQPEAAVEQFARLLADRRRTQGPRHQDTELARHQLAHWHGRAGRTQEAVRRYEEMHRSAEREGRAEAAVTLLCEMGYWQQQGGDNAAALRTFARMLKTAQQALGPGHPSANIARQRYAEVAGGLPFGDEGGDEGLADVLATAAAVEASGDFRRAGRMYGQIAALCEQVHGPDSAQTLSARSAQAKAAVRAGDHAAAADCFGQVLACLELRGQGPGSPEYDVLLGQREELARMAERPALHVAQRTVTLLAESLLATARTACAVLVREADASHATRFAVVDDSADPTWRDGAVEWWTTVLRELSGQGHVATALCFARDDLRPTAEEAALCERLGLAGVYVSRPKGGDGDGGRNGDVHVQAYVFGDGAPATAQLVVVGDEQPPATGGPDAPVPAPAGAPAARTAMHDQAAAIGTWRKMKRARPAPGAELPAAFGAYEVLESVGEGGFGRVYLCQDPDGLMVAVKTLHAHLAAAPLVKQGFAHEVRAAQRVGGRFTVPVIAADIEGPVPWMAVPYVAAPSLQELLDHCGRLDVDLVRTLGAGIAVALGAIHAEGIVHLDLKPANVLLTEDGPRVIDFGIAQIERLTEPRDGFTGTPAFASPEQLRGQPAFTPASDVFSLGTVLAHLVLGRSPWGRDTPTVVANIRAGRPRLTGLPAPLAEVVPSCLHQDPERRPRPEEVAEALVPGAGAGGIGRPVLPEQARELVAERATVPATRRYATLADSRAQTEAFTVPARPESPPAGAGG
ncbi:protein kinase domain-containing protein [Streptacidiphilus anmyonensis]|uniref:protein kinase domain-containing protein n=1 Tax=Streptacidiphilus anmyonensis TaxID=405782 RepID=UPI000AF9D4A5|nr:protein kinase [Streptacidiphilus anmyonensis]